jgi:hypothetical protein
MLLWNGYLIFCKSLSTKHIVENGGEKSCKRRETPSSRHRSDKGDINKIDSEQMRIVARMATPPMRKVIELPN